MKVYLLDDVEIIKFISSNYIMCLLSYNILKFFNSSNTVAEIF
ncbi:Hypothetical protein I595_2481 [Croceitalea dokdonensis DOKDO 023]|uniref:Uncharacterized protein n=1 Tax=Croceitalea dokdonensis DOKDO 023 TaxID=1300341 RepID=A0A0P7AY05_9FLAO|nr:Hypothetical protein I595_2481 [Croceitalea dokdonensis DOKDO 023]